VVTPAQVELLVPAEPPVEVEAKVHKDSRELAATPDRQERLDPPELLAEAVLKEHRV